MPRVAALFRAVPGLSPVSAIARHWRLVASRPRVRRLTIAGLLAAWSVLVGFAVLTVVLRYAVLPQVAQYRGQIEQAVTEAVGLPVHIGSLSASWRGLRPRLTLKAVTVDDSAGQAALNLPHVEAVIGWRSLFLGAPVFHELVIASPALMVERQADGRLVVAGLPVGEPVSQGAEVSRRGWAEWLSAQGRLQITDAVLSWTDRQRGAPPLVLEDVEAIFENRGREKHFALQATPPSALASTLRLQGVLDGQDLARLDDWEGELFVELDYTDLAAWRAWVDYPIDLPQGNGGVRLWLALERGEASTLTADLALRDARLRLQSELPWLELERLSGRVGGRLEQSGRIAAWTRQLTLKTHDGIELAPTDFSGNWRPGAEGEVSGAVTVNRLDFGVLAALAAHLPLDRKSRQRLVDYAPRGRLQSLEATFAGSEDALTRFELNTRFERLGLKAEGAMPGFDAISGYVKGNEQGGTVILDVAGGALLLPAVFPEPRLALDQLKGEVSWARVGNETEVTLKKISFANSDAHGQASGTYRTRAGGAGQINLTAGLVDAKGASVWRYLPLVVNPDARRWVRESIVSGMAHDARLVLKGNLDEFPFVGGSKGLFRVTARAENVKIDYAQGWPSLTGIHGTFRFEGPGMWVNADRGTVMGVALGPVTVEIPDFDADEQMLLVRGTAKGNAGGFVRFVNESPVAGRIGNFTRGMKAEGPGELALELDMPLSHVVDTAVRGHYGAKAHRLTLADWLPPFTAVAGELRFTEDSLSLPKASGQFLGGPVRVKGRTVSDGGVELALDGQARVDAARRDWPHPLLARLSGATDWRALVNLKNGQAGLTVRSDLKGLQSRLPPPFAKAADSRRDWQLRYVPTGAGSELTTVLQGMAEAKLLFDGSRRLQRYAISSGMALPALPERGGRIDLRWPEVDLALWKGMASSGESGGLPLQANLRSDRLLGLGQTFHDVDLVARSGGKDWRVDVAAREAQGQVLWSGAGRGKVSGIFQRLQLAESSAAAPSEGPSPADKADKEERSDPDDATQSLPAVDLTVSDFRYGNRALGRLALQAINESRVWRINRLQLSGEGGSIDVDGRWAMGPRSETRLNVQVRASDSGQLLARLGYPGLMRGGEADIDGWLAWQGSPLALHRASLQGELDVAARNGQFSQVDPGLGRLIGVFSLQALPQRVTLDFRDVFSEGFAYSRMKGHFSIRDGVMQTDPFSIKGPAASVAMRGSINLAAETQALKVRVEPALSDTVSVGTALVNPLAGAAVFLTQKIFKDPLGQAFAYNYDVSGSWKDPKVVKIEPPRIEEAR